MDEKEFDEILTYLSKNKYPEYMRNKDARSNWRKKCRPFSYCKNEDKVYYNHKKHGALLVVKGVENKKKIIETIHIQSDGHHNGINKTLREIISRYYWKTIAKDVQNHIKIECSTCIKQGLQQKMLNNMGTNAKDRNDAKSAKKIVDKAMEEIGADVIGDILEPTVVSARDSTFSGAFKGEPNARTNLQPQIPRANIMAQCSLDVIGPVSETHKGKQFILILTDYVTKWVEAIALRDFTTEAIGEFIAEVMCRHGQIEEIQVKHDSDFCERLAEKVRSIMGFTVRMLNIPPHSNGYIDKYWYNDILCGALLKYTNVNRYYWDIYLNQAILAYRTFHQKNFNWSPFQQLYSRPVRLKVAGHAQPSPDELSNEQEALLCHMNNYINAFSCPSQQPSVNMEEKITSSYIPHSVCVINAQQQSSDIVASCTQTSQSNNTIPNSSHPIIASLGSNIQSIQQTAQNTAIPIKNNLTSEAVQANSIISHAVSDNDMNTHDISVHALENHTDTTNTLPVHTISENTNSTANTIITNRVTNHVMAPHMAITHSNAVQPQAGAENPSGHMVMIHTDGKTFSDSFYVICPQ